MKSLTKTDCRAVATLLVALWLLLAAVGAVAQVPPPPDPPRLVNDLAGVLSDTDAMEDTLEAFARNTSNQIVVVTVNDLGGLEPWEFAQKIGQTWGVGGKEHNNGIVLLVKPKTDESKGRAFIATGYGLEGAMTDAFCTRVVNREMIPAFKENDYTEGVWRALRVLMPVTSGEYSEQVYLGDDNSDDADLIDIIIALIIVILVCRYVYKFVSDGGGGGGGFGGGKRSGTWGGPVVWSSGSSWGSGHSSSSSWGGSSGGFGGFGGGSFGGGGGGGSW